MIHTPRRPEAVMAAPEVPAPATSRRAAERARLNDRANALSDRMRQLLPEAYRRLPIDLDDALGEAQLLQQMDWEDLFVDALARHFPAFAPAIRAVAAHVADAGNYRDADDPRAYPCGLVQAFPPDFRLDGCTGDVGPVEAGS